jgi:hypothetical protein
MSAEQIGPKSQAGKGIAEIEAYLETTLRPVSPRKVFIDDLKQQLDENQVGTTASFSMIQVSVAVFTVLVGGPILFFSLVRLMVSLVRGVRDRRGGQ